MFLMMAEVLRFRAMHWALRGSGFWRVLAHQQTHSAWRGCTLHDLIMPSFAFLVGVSLPFSIAGRRARGQSFGRVALHAGWRSFLLIALGIFLGSLDATRTVWSFHNTLTQIGLGYGFLFLLGFRPVRDQWMALGAILIGYFATFALYPLPAADFDYQAVAVPAAWLKTNGLSGFAAHWQINSNLGWAVETWLMNLFPRDHVFVGDKEGYATLSFIPTLGTMILGLIAGGVLKSDRPPVRKVRWIVFAGLSFLAAGWLLDALGLCPIVKRLWPPSFVLFSGGWSFLFLAAFYAVIDLWQKERWAFPLVVVGMNSIAAYCIGYDWRGYLLGRFTAKNLKTHLGQDFFKFAGNAYEPLFLGLAVLAVYWLVLYWMCRRKIFLRI